MAQPSSVSLKCSFIIVYNKPVSWLNSTINIYSPKSMTVLGSKSKQTCLARNITTAFTDSLLWHFCRRGDPEILT